MNKFKVVMGFQRMTNSEKVTFAQQVVAAMTNNPLYTDVGPILTKLNDALTAANEALDNAADQGLKAMTLLRQRIAELHKRLQVIVYKVEELANDDPENAENIIVSAGFRLKRPATRIRADFSVRNTSASGRVRLESRWMSRTQYIWQYQTTAGDEWIDAGTTLTSTHHIEKLKSGTKVAFRMATLHNGEQSGWSPVIEVLII